MKENRALVLLITILLFSCSVKKETDSNLSMSTAAVPSTTHSEEKKEVEVILDYNFGYTEKKEMLTLEYHRPYSLPIPETGEERGDAYFSGWYKGATRVETSGDSFPYQGKVTLTAHYESSRFSGKINSSGTITLTGVKERSGVVEIPSYYDGRKVTALASSLFYGNKKVKKVILPEGIESIGDSCFGSCPNLREIHLPKSLKEIGEEAFLNDGKLKTVYYAGDVSSWLSLSFSEDSNPCCNLADLYFSNKEVGDLLLPSSIKQIPDYAFHGVRNLTSLSFEGKEVSIGEMAFAYCKGLKKIVFPSNTSFLGGSVFLSCTSLKEITLPGSLASIPEHCFESCSSLSKAVREKGMTQIESSAFKKCYDLKSISLPDGLISIGQSAFEKCNSLSDFSFPSTLEEIDEDAFSYCSSLTRIELPSSLTFLGTGAFTGTIRVTERKVEEENSVYYSYGNTILEKESKKVVSGCKASSLPSDTLIIGESSFFGCSLLESLDLPSSVTGIENYAFANCFSLLSIHIPASTGTIGKNVFTGDTALIRITVDSQNTSFSGEGNCLLSKDKSILYYGCRKSIIPGEVKTIADEAFYYCTSLKTIVIPDGVTSIGSNAFGNCYKLSSVILPDSVTFLGSGAFQWCSGRKSIDFGEGLTSIPDNVLKCCDARKTITLGSKVEEIGDFAFYQTSQVQSLTLPKTVKTIGSGAFARTDREIILEEGNSNFKREGNCLLDYAKENLYYGNSRSQIPNGVKNILPYAFYANEALESLTLPSSLESIGDEAFAYSSLCSLILPSSLKTIGRKAFEYCENLSSLSYQGKRKRFKKVFLDYGAFNHVQAEEIVCEDGSINLTDDVD